LYSIPPYGCCPPFRSRYVLVQVGWSKQVDPPPV
jgi:hypothetical protein